MSEFKSGFVSMAGKPNVGKSTIINALMGQKIVITSDKPQTTRNRINCVLTQEDHQIVFVDTPGIHKPLHKLGKYMVDIAIGALRGVDLILFVVDPIDGVRKSDLRVAEIINGSKIPAIIVINKIDAIKNKGIITNAISKLEGSIDNLKGIFEVSALTGENLSELLNAIKTNLPEGPKYYPDDIISDKPSRFIISELIREKIFHLTREEIPHSTGVVVEDLKQRENGMLYVRAEIYIEKDSQKPIIIGKSGTMIKKIGQHARKDIEELFEMKVYLDLFVKVRKKWRENDNLIKNTMRFKDDINL
ncbi:GTPase Era [Oceanotoga sp. DSM 15011]|jgi:GTP-binding protein Era|uniref:GTPase Era n=1 Tax=Oceanotoga TaxID=1255275 RepID=UPI0021F4C793|nr:MULTISPECIES: GTPase Era [Oceanotoga]MDN5342014.1 GTPase [Oceanotoga sp.]MDO7976026.1 GTPase Era [Oceanotoga teriensis]UYO98979.1 GTPase Era [Oceanotoga sp. DSM 15011]